MPARRESLPSRSRAPGRSVQRRPSCRRPGLRGGRRSSSARIGRCSAAPGVATSASGAARRPAIRSSTNQAGVKGASPCRLTTMSGSQAHARDSAQRSVPLRQSTLVITTSAPKPSAWVADAVVVGGDHDPVGARDLHRGLPAAPDQAARLASGAAQLDQRLAGIAGRGVAGGDDDQDGHLSPCQQNARRVGDEERVLEAGLAIGQRAVVVKAHDLPARAAQDRVARRRVPFHRAPKPRVQIRLAGRDKAELQRRARARHVAGPHSARCSRRSRHRGGTSRPRPSARGCRASRSRRSRRPGRASRRRGRASSTERPSAVV